MPETIAVVEELHAQGRRVVLAGLCAGAWAALQTAVCVPVDGVVAINVQIYWKPGDPVDALITTTIERRARDRERETRGQRWGAWTALDLLGVRSREGRWLDQLRRTGRPVLLLFAEGDEGMVFLRGRLRRRLRQTLRSGTVRLVEIPGIDHTMHRSWLRGPLRAELLRFARELAA